MIKAILYITLLAMHPVHVSMSSLDYSRETGAFHVFVKMYYDDFLTDSGQIKPGQIVPAVTDDELFKKIVHLYLDEKLMIFIDKKQLEGKLQDAKLIDGEVVVRMVFNAVNPRGNLTVRNLIMTSLHDDQANMMIIKVNELEEGIKLTSEKTEQTFKID
jgi:hypothetical protein